MKKQPMLLGVLTIIILSGCIQPEPEPGPEPGPTTRVAEGGLIKVHYKGTLSDGTQFDSSEGRDPLEFTAGAGQMIKGFDSAVIGMALNEEKTVTLTPDQAYGQEDPARIVEIPKTSIQNADSLQPGMTVTNSQGANGTVQEIKQDTIVINFNHRLAGKTLTFWIKIVDIQKQ
jgi:FKBP-type peptidyl-prolyl cis-trans isomerase 2